MDEARIVQMCQWELIQSFYFKQILNYDSFCGTPLFNSFNAVHKEDEWIPFVPR